MFKEWINLYPFIRMQIRESMMPRLWSLKSDYAVKRYDVPKPINSEANEKDRADKYLVGVI